MFVYVFDNTFTCVRQHIYLHTPTNPMYVWCVECVFVCVCVCVCVCERQRESA